MTGTVKKTKHALSASRADRRKAAEATKPPLTWLDLLRQIACLQPGKLNEPALIHTNSGTAQIKKLSYGEVQPGLCVNYLVPVHQLLNAEIDAETQAIRDSEAHGDADHARRYGGTDYIDYAASVVDYDDGVISTTYDKDGNIIHDDGGIDGAV